MELSKKEQRHEHRQYMQTMKKVRKSHIHQAFMDRIREIPMGVTP